MTKSDIKVIPPYYIPYVALTGNGDLLDELEEGGISVYFENLEQLEAIGLKTYAPGKWTVPQIIEHVIDTERIFQYRALRFARQDKTDLPGFDENMYANVSRANNRSVDDLLEEFEIVRESTAVLFHNLDSDQLNYTGKANGMEVSVAALGFMLIGHSLHHFNTIRERYFPLV